METTLDPKRWLTCVHEAGHAVCALLLGVEGIGCIVFDNGGGLATPDPLTDAMPPPEEHSEKNIENIYAGKPFAYLMTDSTWTAAGCVAVDLILNPDKPETNVGGADGDMVRRAGREILKPYHSTKAEMDWCYLIAERARTILKPNIGKIKMVAKELSKRGRMTAEDVLEAMYPHIVERVGECVP